MVPGRTNVLYQILAGYKSRAERETTTSYSEEEETDSDTPAAGGGNEAGTPVSEEEDDRIFIKQDSGQFIAVRASQVLFQKSHLAAAAAALDPRNTGSRKKRAAPPAPTPDPGRMDLAECDRTNAAAAAARQ